MVISPSSFPPPAPIGIASTPQPFEPSKATTALVLAILSWFVCGIFMSIPAVIIARGETAAINQGRRDPANAGKAKAAFWIGVINIVFVPIIAVVAILAALLVPTVLNQAERARASRAASEVNEIGKSFVRMRNDLGSGASPYCFTMQTLTSSTVPSCAGYRVSICSPNNTDGAACWGGPYMAATVAKDPWSHDYRISLDRNTNSVRVTSAGPDGLDGTSDDITKVF